MSNYTKSISFASKDSLLTGDPAKKIKGIDVDTELDLIHDMSVTKADKIAPAVAGNVAKLDSSGNLADAGYRFTNLSGAVLLTLAEINTLDGITANVTELNYLDGCTAGTVLTTGDEGSGNGIDADTVDGQHYSDIVNAILANNTTIRFKKYDAALYMRGDENDGDISYTYSQSIASGEYNCSSWNLDAGVTLDLTESSNAWLFIRCSGTVTIAGTIDLDYKGRPKTSVNSTSVGNDGYDGYFGASGGGGGSAHEGGSANGGAGGDGFHTAGGAGGVAHTSQGVAGATPSTLLQRQMLAYWGAEIQSWGYPFTKTAIYGGGSGGNGGSYGGSKSAGGQGGAGGGALIIIAQEIIFTGTINARGQAGESATGDDYAPGGGGGGGGVLMCAETWTTDTGTINNTGGAAGSYANALEKAAAGGTGFAIKATLT